LNKNVKEIQCHRNKNITARDQLDIAFDLGLLPNRTEQFHVMPDRIDVGIL